MIECDVKRTTDRSENAGSRTLTRFVMSLETGIELWRSIAFVELESLSSLTKKMYPWSEWKRYRGKDRGGKDIMMMVRKWPTHLEHVTFIRVSTKIYASERDVVLVICVVMINAVTTWKRLGQLKNIAFDNNVTLLACISFSNSTQAFSKVSTTLQISGNCKIMPLS